MAFRVDNMLMLLKIHLCGDEMLNLIPRCFSSAIGDRGLSLIDLQN